jgi:anaerobic selenocysteine-containing dehydrogenase
MFTKFDSKVYKKDKQWQEGEYTVTRNMQWSGPGCHEGCGVLFYTKDGKLVKVEGDPNSEFNQGRLCMRCLNMMEAVYHPDRLKWPLKRVGKRGENKWERISWDQALDIIEEKVHHVQKEYGPESIVGMIGTGRNACWQVPYMVYAGFGSPNFALGFLSGDACMLPRNALTAVMAGTNQIMDASQMFPDRYNNPEWKAPECIVIWGTNPIINNADGFFGHWITDCMKLGSKLIVIDPSLTWLASKADIWLRVRPGTDAALAMGMLDVIIKEDLYDHEFVEKWTTGFTDLAERVAQYPAAKAAEITWVPEEQIIQAARMYAQAKPAAIQWGLALDMQITGIASAHAVESLWTITGNVDIPGGNILVYGANNINLTYNLGLYEWIPEELIQKRFGLQESPLKKYGMGASAHGDTILKAIESGKPYPVKMLWMQSTNPIANMGAEAHRVYKAITSVDFCVVADLFMTPTAVACADLVLPVAMSFERDSIRNWYFPLSSCSKVADPYEECKSDEEITMTVVKRLHPEAFPWNSVEEWLDYLMMENGNCEFPFKELADKVFVYPKFEYRKHEKGLNREDRQPGFNTVSGKLELRLSLFDAWGLDPLPYYQEPPDSPFSTPELFKEYPLILTTGQRSFEFFHSEHRQLPTMREFHPYPKTEINPETAAELGIKEGDWVWIENMRGKCKQIAKFNITLHPKVVRSEHGWWFPEKQGAEPVLFGVFDSNINNLTPQCQNDQCGYGAPYKSQICKIYKVTPENDKKTPTEIVTQEGGFGYVK